MHSLYLSMARYAPLCTRYAPLCSPFDCAHTSEPAKQGGSPLRESALSILAHDPSVSTLLLPLCSRYGRYAAVMHRYAPLCSRYVDLGNGLTARYL